MLGLEGERRLDVRHRCIAGLPGQTVHDVQVDVVEAGLARQTERSDGVVGPVNAAQARQLLAAERLGAERQSIDAGTTVLCEVVVFDRSWIGFQRDLDG